MEASFWERSTVLPLRRLDRQSSGDAIRIPFEAIGNAIEPEALAAVAEDSHGYPFFLQLWGVALWERIRGSGRPLTVEDVDRSRARFEETRNSFYEFRYRELLKSRLLFEAVALSDAFRDSEEVPDSTIRSALAADMRRRGTVPSDEAVGRALDALHGLGYVWVPGGGPVGGIYRAGIPSLMECVVRTAAHGESFQTPTADRPSRVGSATAAIHRDGE